MTTAGALHCETKTTGTILLQGYPRAPHLHAASAPDEIAPPSQGRPVSQLRRVRGQHVTSVDDDDDSAGSHLPAFLSAAYVRPVASCVPRCDLLELTIMLLRRPNDESARCIKGSFLLCLRRGLSGPISTCRYWSTHFLRLSPSRAGSAPR